MSKPNAKEKFRVTIYKADTIDAQIVAVAKGFKSLKHKVHSLGVSILKVMHDAKTNEEATKVGCARLNALMQSCPYHAKAFNSWIAANTNLHWSDETNEWYVNTTEDNRIMGKAFIQARDVPFWELSPPADPKPFIMSDAIAAVIKRAETRIKTPVDGDVVDVKALKHLREALKALPTES